jgi:uncharacterized protein (TIGR02246 family)
MIRAFAAAVAAFMLTPAAVHAQPQHSASNREAEDRAADREAVKAVLASYKAAIERLDAQGTEQLFAEESQIFETGGVEGTYRNYLAHHLGPELDHFRSFQFSDYKVDVRFEGPVALATESYRYRIEPKSGDVAERLGVATSVLKNIDGEWKILSMHNSARRPKGS